MKTYFIDNEIYFQNKKLPPRKVEVFDVTLYNDKALCIDKDGNHYMLNKEEIIFEEAKDEM